MTIHFDTDALVHVVEYERTRFGNKERVRHHTRHWPRT